jgi:hypothetical protein
VHVAPCMSAVNHVPETGRPREARANDFLARRYRELMSVLPGR